MIEEEKFSRREADLRKRTEEELRESEVCYRSLFENAVEGIVVAEVATRKFLRANPAFCRMLGYSPEEISAMGIENIHPAESLEYVLGEFRALACGKKMQAEDIPCLRKDGTILYADIAGSAILIDGKTCNVGFFTDVTERKKLHDALRESEERFKNLYQESPIPTFTWQKRGEDFILVDFNRAAAQITDGRAGAYLGGSAAQMYVDKQGILDDLNFCFQKQAVVKREIVSRNFAPGKFLSVHYGFIPPDLIIVHTEDQTDRKQAENVLMRIQKAVESSGEAIGMATPQGSHFYQNKAFLELFGYSVEELNKPLAPVVVYADPEVGREVFATIMRGDPWVGETIMVAKGGRRFPVFLRADAVKDDNGNIIGLIGIHTDITERKLAEEKLNNQMSFISALLDTIPSPIFYKDTSGKYLGCNRAYEEIIGKSREEVVGKDIYDLYPPEIADLYAEKDRELYERPGSQVYDGKFSAADGTVRDVIISKATYTDTSKNVAGLVGVFIDITARKQAEEALWKAHRELRESKDMLVQSEKMAALGQLVTGADHEFRNPLHIMAMIIGLLEMDGGLSDETRQNLNLLKGQIRRIVTILDGLRDFSSLPQLKKVPNDMNEIVRGSLASHAHGPAMDDIAVEAGYEADLPPAMLDADMMGRVFAVLIANAADAMQGRENKSIRVTTRSVRAKDRQRWIQVAVADAGSGIKNEDLDGIFNPFFTTKDPDKGKGLGLSIAYRIIQDHGGRIWAENNERGGATFFIELPAKESYPG